MIVCGIISGGSKGGSRLARRKDGHPGEKAKKYLVMKRSGVRHARGCSATWRERLPLERPSERGNPVLQGSREGVDDC